MTSRLTVEFALPAGGVHRQRVQMKSWVRIHEVIRRALATCKRRGRVVANVLYVYEGKACLWHWQDQGSQFR